MFKAAFCVLLLLKCTASDVLGNFQQGTFINKDEIAELMTISVNIDDSPVIVTLPSDSTWFSLQNTAATSLGDQATLEIVRTEEYDEMQILLGHLTFGAEAAGDTAVAKSNEGIAVQVALDTGQSWSIMALNDGKDILIASQSFNSLLDHSTEDVVDYGSGYTDTDSEGNYVIDLLCVFSMTTLTLTRNRQGFCRSHVEMVNLALIDSGITNIKLRALPIFESPMDVSANTTSMATARDLLWTHREDLGADLIVVFMIRPGTFADTDQGGFLTITELDVPNYFRHLVGHNIGLQHCVDKSALDIMCVNQEGVYKNDDVTDKWLVRGVEVSSYMPAMKAADGSFGKKVVQESVTSAPLEFSIKGGASKLLIILRVDEIADKTKDVTVYARQGVFNVSSTAYTHAATGPGTAILTIENPAAGRWTAIGSAPVAAKISVYLYITDTGVPDLLCDAKAEAGAGRGTYEKWLTASITARDDGTDDLINFTWAIKEDPHSVMSLMPGGVEGASTLIYYDGPENQTYSGGVVTLTCVDTYYNISKSIDISLE